MKFAYVCSDVDIPLFGPEGCSIHVREVVNALYALGHDVVVFCSSLGDADRSLAGGVAVHSFFADEEFGRCLKLLENEPVVQEHGLDRDLASVMGNWWLRGKGLAILKEEKPDVIYERYALFGNAGLYISRQCGVPLLVEVNSPLRKEQEGYEKFTLPRMAQAIEQEVLANADTVISVSRWLRDWMVGEGVAPEKVHVIPNGISERVFASPRSGEPVRAEFGLTGKKVIAYIGSFQKWHDVAGLTGAFKTLLSSDPNVRLLLIGAGNEREAIESRLRAERLAHAVIFAGHVRYEDVPEYLAAADVHVVPYSDLSDFYFSPIKLFECMASGRPTVAAAIGQIEEIIEHAKTGWLYRPGDIADLARALQTLLYDARLSSAVGAAGRARILDSHTWTAVAGRIVELAAGLVEGKVRVSGAKFEAVRG